MADLIVFWHRRDLRLADNMGLSAARDRSPKVIGVFCLDPGLLDGDDVAPGRVAYMLGCLEELQNRYGAAGGQLLIVKGNPREKIPALAKVLNATAVYLEPGCRTLLPRARIPPWLRLSNTQALKSIQHFGTNSSTPPGEVMKGAGGPYTVYTPFWRNWNQQAKYYPRSLQPGRARVSHGRGTRRGRKRSGPLTSPGPKIWGFDWSAGFPVEPGEWAAHTRPGRILSG